MFGHFVADHRAQPVAKAAPGRIVAVNVAMLKHRQHHVLDDFLGRMFRAAAMAGKAVDRRPVVRKKLVPGQGVGPVAKPLQQCRPRAGNHRTILSRESMISQDMPLIFTEGIF